MNRDSASRPSWNGAMNFARYHAWPRVLRRFAAEAWRRADAGELMDNELYCYQPCKARLRREREEM